MPILLNSSRNIGLNSSGVVSDKNPLNPAGSFGGIRLSSNKFAYRSTYARLEAAAIAAARRNNAALWYIPDSLAGVYQDSAGTTLPALNAPIGLLLDRSYGVETPGPELVSNGTFDANTSGWAINIGGTLTRNASGSATYASSGVNDNCAYQVLVLEAGKTYRLTVDASAVVAGILRLGTGLGSALWSIASVNIPGSSTLLRLVFVAPQSSVYLSFGYGGSTSSSTVDNVSVREVLGYHATQATAANKPTLVRVPRKLGPELAVNGSFDNGLTGWVTYGLPVSVVAGAAQVTTSAVDQGIANNVTGLKVGASYTVSAKMGRGTATAPLVGIDASGGWGSGIGTSSTTPVLLTRTFEATATSINFVLRTQNTTATYSGDFTIDDFSIREVLEWSYALNFDRVNDVLLASTVLCGDAGTIIAAHQASTVTGAWQALAGTGSAPTTTTKGVRLRVATNTPPVAGIDVAWSATSSFVNSGALTAPTVVQSGSWDATAVRGYLGGVQTGSATAAAGIGNGQPFYLGALSAPGGDAFSGAIHLLCIAPVVMPDADRIAIERYGAYLSGANYVG